MEIHRVKRDLPHVLEAHHDHAGHPEEQDVVARLEDASGVVLPQIGRLVWPAEGAVWPKRGAEPRVEHVRILFDLVRAAARAACRVRRVLVGYHDLVAVAAEPRRDRMPPPDLTGHRPVADLVHPVEEHLLLVTRHDRDETVPHDLGRARRELGHAHPPLLHHERLVDRLAAVVNTDSVSDRLLAHEKLAVIIPRLSIAEIVGRPCRWPISKSVAS